MANRYTPSFVKAVLSGWMEAMLLYFCAKFGLRTPSQSMRVCVCVCVCVCSCVTTGAGSGLLLYDRWICHLVLPMYTFPPLPLSHSDKHSHFANSLLLSALLSAHLGYFLRRQINNPLVYNSMSCNVPYTFLKHTEFLISSNPTCSNSTLELYGMKYVWNLVWFGSLPRERIMPYRVIWFRL